MINDKYDLNAQTYTAHTYVRTHTQLGGASENLFLAVRRFSRIPGSSPTRTLRLTKQLPVGVLMYSSAANL